MSISRRKFIQVGAVSLLALGVPVAGANYVFGQELRQIPTGDIGPGDIPYESQKDPLFYFTKETFIPYINSTFQLRTAKGKVGTFTLIAVDEFQLRPGKDLTRNRQTQAFSLYFTGGSRLWPQDTYTVSHDALGTFNMLVVPIVSRDVQQYQAVINHLV